MTGLTKPQLYAHLAQRLPVKRTVVRAFFVELERLAAYELKRTGEFVIPGVTKLVVTQRPARQGRHPLTGAPITIPPRTALKARLKKPLKDAVLPR